jgi:hypothetical protein
MSRRLSNGSEEGVDGLLRSFDHLVNHLAQVPRPQDYPNAPLVFQSFNQPFQVFLFANVSGSAFNQSTGSQIITGKYILSFLGTGA